MCLNLPFYRHPARRVKLTKQNTFTNKNFVWFKVFKVLDKMRVTKMARCKRRNIEYGLWNNINDQIRDITCPLNPRTSFKLQTIPLWSWLHHNRWGTWPTKICLNNSKCFSGITRDIISRAWNLAKKVADYDYLYLYSSNL